MVGREETYTYSPAGQRISKTVDGVTTKYFYDGGNVIAEYDDSNDLMRKYIYGPGVDEPLCMIDVEDSNSFYYYHFDGLGSVVALSDAAGDTIQTYEYSIYGRVRGTDPNHPNPYLFTGRRFDTETGLYYYRARYYNPYIGRFMQTDPVGYSAGTNLYTYCGNNPVGYVDPLGTHSYTFTWHDSGFTVKIYDDDGTCIDVRHGTDPDDFYEIMLRWNSYFNEEWMLEQAAGALWSNSVSVENGTDMRLFWEIQMLIEMDVFSEQDIRNLGQQGVIIKVAGTTNNNGSIWDPSTNTITWERSNDDIYGGVRDWNNGIALENLAHELDHAYMYYFGNAADYNDQEICEKSAVYRGNLVRKMAIGHFENYKNLLPRLFWGQTAFDLKDVNPTWSNYQWWKFYDNTGFFELN